MTMENSRIDQLFKEKLGNFEQNPPVGLLDKISEQIVFRSKVRRINQIKAVVGIAAALVLVALAGWFTVSRQDQFVENKSSNPIRQSQLIAEPAKTLTAEISEKKLGAPIAHLKHSGKPAAKNMLATLSKSPVNQSQIPTTAVSNINNASVTSSTATTKEVPAGNSVVAQANQIAQAAKVAKEETKSAYNNNYTQKKGESRYFAEGPYRSTPAASNPAKGGWELKAELSPMFASQNQGGSSSASTATKSANTISGGMVASIKLSKRVSISSGIRFSQMRQDTHSDYYMNTTAGIIYLQPVEKDANIARDVSLYLPSVSSIVYSSGMQASATTKIFASDVSQQFKYLEIPVQASYKLIDNKLSVGVTGGISTNILIGNLASVTENGIKLSQGSTDNLRNVIYSGSAGLQFGYDLGNRLMLTVEPRVKQYMHSVSSNDLVDFKPLQLGIFTGISYSFK